MDAKSPFNIEYNQIEKLNSNPFEKQKNLLNALWQFQNIIFH
jgi:hypothetical protein